MVDRSGEAEELKRILLGSSRRLLVLYGKAGIGKTDLIRNWLRRPLEETGPAIFYGACSPDFPDAVEHDSELQDPFAAATDGATVFVDEFDQVLAGDHDRRDEVLRELSAWAERAEGEGRFVLVVRDAALGELFSVANLAPELLKAKAVIEIPGVGLGNGLRSLRVPEAREDRGQSHLIEVLSADPDWQEATGGRVSPDLVRVLDFMSRKFAEEIPTKELQVEDFADSFRSLGLGGVLDEYLQLRLRELEKADSGDEQPGRREIASALLGEIAMTDPDVDRFDVEAVALRLGAPAGTCRQTLDWLVDEAELIRTHEGCFAFVPMELEEVVEEAEQRSDETANLARSILARGVRNWLDFSVLLPRGRFLEVHEARKYLFVEDAEARFLVLCSLLYDDRELSSARYWLRRVADPAVQEVTLLHALLNERRIVRRRAAKLLAHFDSEEVRSQLLAVALQDSEETVRREAVASLEHLTVGDLWPAVRDVARDPYSAQREPAVRALRVFKSEQAAHLAAEILRDRNSTATIRKIAIDSLASIGTRASIERLLDVALYDEDEEDREGALAALVRLDDPELVRSLKEELERYRPVEREEPDRPRQWSFGDLAFRVVASLLVPLLNLFFHGLVLILLGRRKLGGVLLGLEALGAGLMWIGAAGDEISATLWVGLLLWLGTLFAGSLLPLKQVLHQRRGRPDPDSTGEILFLGLFLGNSISTFLLVHGLAHAVKPRVRGDLRRIRLLLGAEVLGIALFLIVFMLAPIFEVTVGPFPEATSLALYYGYLTIASALFFGSWIYDAGRILIAAGQERKISLYRELLARSKLAEVLYEEAGSPTLEVARRAQRRLRKYARDLSPAWSVRHLASDHRRTASLAARSLRRTKDAPRIKELKRLWGAGGKELRKRVISILGRRPTAESVKALGDLEGGLALRRRLCLIVAKARLALPMPTLLTILIALPLVFILLYEGVRNVNEPFRAQIKTLRSERKPSDLRARYARAVAAGAPVEFLDEATGVLRKEEARNTDARVRMGIVEGLGSVASAERGVTQGRAVDGLLHALTSANQEVRRAASEELERAAASAPSEELVERLGRPLRTGDHPEVLRHAAEALAIAAIEAGHRKRLPRTAATDTGRVDRRMASLQAEAEKILVEVITGEDDTAQLEAINGLKLLARQSPRTFEELATSELGPELAAALERAPQTLETRWLLRKTRFHQKPRPAPRRER